MKGVALRLPVAAALIAALLFGAVPTPVSAESFIPSPEPIQGPPKGLDAATKKVLALEQQIEDIRAEQIALDNRITLTSQRVLIQQQNAEDAQARLDEAQGAYLKRLVDIYKAGPTQMIYILLSAEDLPDLVSRGMLLQRVSEGDKTIFDNARLMAAEAAFQTRILDDLRSQDVKLREIKEGRLEDLETSLVEQKAIVAELSERQKQWLFARQKLDREMRERWKKGSIPIGQPVPTATAVVDPYSHSWLVAAYQPRHYKTTGMKFTAVCSWYGPGFNGKNTASGQVFNEEDLTCASRTLPFGTRLALTRAGRRIIVVVNDRGPYIEGRDLDLSKAAARALGFSGVEPVEAEVVTIAQ